MPEGFASNHEKSETVLTLCRWRFVLSPIQILPSRYSDSLRAGRSGDRFPVGARFTAPVQTGPGAHPASCTIGKRSFPGVKWPGRGVNHLLTSSVEVKESVELYLYSLIWAFVACSKVTFTPSKYWKLKSCSDFLVFSKPCGGFKNFVDILSSLPEFYRRHFYLLVPMTMVLLW